MSVAKTPELIKRGSHYDCMSIYSFNIIIIDCKTGRHESAYRADESFDIIMSVLLNVHKTKVLTVDYRKLQGREHTHPYTSSKQGWRESAATD